MAQVSNTTKTDDMPRLGDRLNDQQVVAFANLALQGLNKEYPNKPSNVMADEGDVQSPKEMHPAFYGCFDWHSSVHGHWMLVRLLRLYPENSSAERIRAALQENLTRDNIQVEAAYFREKHNRTFERMYGWAWALRLVAELEEWDNVQANQWRENLRPLESVLVEKTMDYLPKLTYPIRTGVHPDTGFALGQILDYARVVNNTALADLIVERSKQYYLNDVNYPASYEPSGEDFFSAGLNEADLMRRVLPQDEFADWLTRFLPNLGVTSTHNLLSPVDVSDVTDGKIVHLAGLDLSRGWCLQGICSSLPADDVRRNVLTEAATAHADKGFEYVFSGHYEGEHWLATFAIYLLSEVGVD